MLNGNGNSDGRNLKLALPLILALTVTPTAWANPTGGSVEDGEVEISSNGSTLTVTQGTERAIINWQDFSIGAGEITRFLQPSSSSATLNRVISNNPSELFGTLEANGTVLLINQNGILVGEGAAINVNSFLASTLNIDSTSFMAGAALRFMGDSRAAIRNLGSITADGGNVYLIARQIDNQGNISASGEAGMFAGAEVVLAAEGSGASVRIADVGALEEGEAITNSGAVQAAMVTMDATGSMYSVAVNNSGVVRATGADTSGGRVRLTGGAGTVLHSGVVDASGSTGGSVEMTGDRVGLTGNAVVDASGTAGDGGEVYIGGGWQGGDADIDNASRTFVGSDVTISVDAGANGDGGTAVVWADEVTRFGGTISARGGSESGDGGNVEVSGAGHLQFVGLVDTSAANGSAGLLLLDPADLEINDDPADANINAGGAPALFQPNADTSILTWTTIFANLDLGNVEVTTNNGVGSQTGNITITESPDFQSQSGIYDEANTLTLTTAPLGGITVNAAVTNAGTGGLVLNPGDGGININAALDFDTITLNSGNRTLGVGDTTGAAVELDSAELLLITAGTLTLNSGYQTPGAAIIVDGVDAGATANIDNLSLSATDGSGATDGADVVFQTTASTIDSNLTVLARNHVDILVDLDVNGTFTATAQDNTPATGAITISDTLTVAGEVILAADTMDITAAINAAGQRVTLRPDTASLTIDLGVGTDTAGTQLGISTAELDLITADVVRIGDANSATLSVTSAITTAGTNSLILGSGIGINDSANAANIIDVANLATRGAGPVTLGGAAHTATTFASSTTGAVILEVGGALAIGSVGTINGVNLGANALTLTTNGNLTQTLPLTVSDLTVDTTGNALTLGNTSNNVSGVVSLDGTAVEFQNDVATQLGNIFATTSLSIVSDEAITQAVATIIDSDGDTAFETTDDDQAITLGEDNLISGEITFTTQTAGGNAGHVTLVNDGTITFSGLATSIAGDLTVTQNLNGGQILQNGAGSISVAGLTTLTNLNADDGDALIANDGDLVFGPGVSTIDGDLTVVTINGGNLSQTGAIRVNGDFDATGVTGTSTIDNAANIFDGAYTDSQGSIILRRVGDIDINAELGGGAINTGAGNLTVIALAEGDEFDAAAPGGVALDLSNTANSFGGGVVISTGAPVFTTTNAGTADIIQSDNLTVGGTATFSSVADAGQAPFAGGVIDLTTNTNTLSGVIQLRGDTVSLSNTGATNLGTTTTTSALSVVSTLGITDSGIITSSGTSSFQTTNAGSTIVLDGANLLTGAVTLTSNSGHVSLNNNQATLLGNVNANAAGNFAVTSNGTITQEALTAITVANLNAVTTAGSVELTSATNTATTLVNGNAAADFRFYDANGFDINGNIVAANTVELNTGATAINQVGGSITATDLVLGGTGTFTFNQAGNNVATLSGAVTGQVSFVDSNTLSLGALSTGNGNLTVTVNTGNMSIDGTVNPGNGSVTLVAAGGQIIQGGAGLIDMGGAVNTLNLNNGAGGAVGSSGTPLLTTGTYQLNTAPAVAGGVFITNGAGNIFVDTLNPFDGTIALVNSGGAIQVAAAVESVTLRPVTLNASTDLFINDTIDGTVINLLSGGVFTVSADVGAAATTAINATHGGALTSAGGTLVTPGVLTINDTGNGTIGNSIVDPLLTQATRIALNKTSSGASFISNNGSLELHGSFNGNLDFRTTAGGNITVGNDASNRHLTNILNAADIVLFSDGQIIGEGVVNAAGANVGLRATSITGNLAGNYLHLTSVGTLEALATAGGVRLSHSGGDLTIGQLASITANGNGGILATAAVDVQQAANSLVNVLGNVTTGNNITIQIADSGPGVDQLLVAGGVTVGSGSGGNIVLGGGVNNLGTLTANAGFTTFLDGGRPTLTLGGVQTFNGNVTFSVTGDIQVTGQIAQNSTSGSILLIADSDDNGQGGIIVTNENDAGAFIRSAGTLTMEAGEIWFSPGLNGGVYNQAGIAIAIASSVANPIVGGLANSGSISLEAFDDAGNGPLDIVIDGIVRSTDATGTLQITSTGGIRMSQDIRGANDVIISNEDTLSRTAPGATIITGGAGELIFLGDGDIGTDALNPILTDVGVVDFDSSGANTKIDASAYIQETGGVSLIGTLDYLNLVANGTVAQTGVLNIALVEITTNSGNITLNTSANLVDAFGVISSSGTFDYLGNQSLQLTNTIDANSSIAINIGTVGGRDLNQLTGAVVSSGNNVNLTVNTATLRDDWNVLSSFTLNNTGLVDRDIGVGDPLADALISANNILLQGAGNVGDGNLLTGLLTAVNTLDINKTDGDVFILEQDAIQIGATSGTLGGVANTLNLSNLTGNITIGAIGINKSSGGNVRLFADNGQILQSTPTPIRMGGGTLLLRAIDGVGSSGAPIVTSGNYTLAALNADGFGGIYIVNQTNADTVVTIGEVQAFTPDSLAVTETFNGLQNDSTNAFGGSDIILNNLRGHIVVDDVVNPNNAGQNVYLLAAGTAGANNFQIQQGATLVGPNQRGVINMQGGDLYLRATAGIGTNTDEASTLKTSGTFGLAARVTTANAGGIYLTSVDYGTSGDITVTQLPAFNLGVFTLPAIDGVSTPAGSTGDIRIQNSGDGAGATGNIIVDRPVTPGTGRNVVLISDNGYIVGGSAAGVINMTGGNLLLSAAEGLGSFADPIRTTGFYDLAVQNSTGGNISILNTVASGGFGNITITDVNDVLLAGGLGTVSGGTNDADGVGEGAIRIRNDAVGANAGDIIAVDTSVTTSGTTGDDAFIELIANDDLNLGDGATQAAATTISTANGAIILTASNANFGDGIDGILVTASDTTGAANTSIAAGGAGGAVTMTATANAGTISILGGDAAGASASVTSAAAMTVTTNVLTIAGSDAAVAGSFAALNSATTQSITVQTGDMSVLGGADGTGNYADVVAAGSQSIDVVLGDLDVFGGAGGDGNYARIQGNQDIIVQAGDLDVIGGAGMNAFAQIESVGNGAAAQDITVGEVMTVRGGTGDGSFAAVNTTQNEGDQVILVQNISDVATALIVEGAASNANSGNEAIIASMSETATAQSITVEQGDVAISGNESVSNTVYGSNGETAGALILTVGGQTIDIEDGALAINGGPRAGAGAGIGAAGDEAQNITVALDVTLTGGAGDGAAAAIESEGAQTLRVGYVGLVPSGTPANLTLTGGDGIDSHARITGFDDTAAAQSVYVADGNLSLIGNADNGNGGGVAVIYALDALSGQYIEVNGDPDGATGNLSITGGGTGGDDAGILSDGATQTIVVANRISLVGGADSNNTFIENTVGTQSITAGTGMSLVGGGDDTDTYVYSSGAQTITVNNDGAATDGELTLLGGAGQDAETYIESDDDQTITVDGYLTITAGDGQDANAYIYGEDLQQISVLGNTLTTFAGMPDTALGLLGGTDGTGGGDAYIEQGSSTGRQFIDLTLGSLVMIGGTGVEGEVYIGSDGEDGAGADEEAQRIIVQAGDIYISGGTGDDSIAEIVQDNSDEASQYIAVNGSFDLLGGAGADAFAAITSWGGDNLGDGGQTILLSGTGDLNIIGGDGESASAGVVGSGLTQTVTVTDGSLLVQGNQDAANTGSNAYIEASNDDAYQVVTVSGGDLTVQGGASDDEYAGIYQSGNDGQQWVNVTGGNLSVIGGPGDNAVAEIFADGVDNGATVAQLVTVNGNLLVQGDQLDAVDTWGYASIWGENTGAATQVVDVEGHITIEGGIGPNDEASIWWEGAGNGGLAQDINALETITVSGGAGADAFAWIVSFNAAGDQSVTARNASGAAVGLTVQGATVGGNVGTEGAIISYSQGAGAQTITVMDGDFEMLANAGVSNTANLDGGAYGNAGHAGGAVVHADGQQVIDVQSGNFIIAGGSETESRAIVAMTDNTQNQAITVDGYMTIAGGSGQSADAYVSANGVQTIAVAGNALVNFGGIADVGLGLMGGIDATDGGDAFIEQIDADDQQSIEVTLGSLVLLGGVGEDADAYISAAGLDNGTEAQRIVVSDGDLMLDAGDAASINSNAYIAQSNPGTASQVITVNGRVDVLGGDGDDEFARITSAGTEVQTLLIAEGLALEGGAGLNSEAGISATGVFVDQTVTVTTGHATLTGGAGENARAFIEQTNAVGTQEINIDAGLAASNLALLGGTGINADAYIAAHGTLQTITLVNGALSVQADQTDAGTADADAAISATNANAVQTIDVTNGGILIQGGVGAAEEALIQMSGANGQQAIRALNTGDVTILGGSGEASSAWITSAGLDAGLVLAQYIFIENGNLLLDAGDGTNDNTNVSINQSNAGTASQVIEVNGSVTLLGGDGTTEYAEIESLGTEVQTLTIATGLTLAGGDGLDSSAGILASGTTVDQTVTVSTGHATLTGGAGENAHAFIAQTDAAGTQDINIDAGLAASNLALLGGTGINADAYIAAFGTLQTITLLNGALTVQADQTDAGTANADAFILADNDAANQDIDVNNGGIIVEGGVGATELAYIQLLGANGTGSQTINLNTTGNFTILGGEGAASSANVDSQGLVQSITLDDGMLSVQGDQTNAATADGSAGISLANNTSGVAVQTIDVTNGGILVQGGTGANETAIVNMLDVDGQQSIHAITIGNLSVLGGVGDAASALISSAGLDNGMVAQSIVLDDGNLVVDAGNGANNNSTAVISQTNAGAASQIVTVNGTVSILGGDGSDEFARITSAGTEVQTLLIAEGLTIAGGDGLNSEAGIAANGTTVDQTVTVTTGHATLTGGAGDNAHAFIEQTDAAGTQDININAASATSNLALLGGTGINADAYIAAFGTLQTVSVIDGALSVHADQTDAGTANADAYILASNTAANQDIDVVNGGITVEGGVGATETAYIALVGGDGTGAQTINLDTTGDFSILGGEGEGSTATVRSDGLIQAITLDDGMLTVQADQDNNATNGGNALISHSLNASGAAVQTLDVTNGGILVQGGVGTETAIIQSLDTDGQQSIHAITMGDLLVLGGVGETASAGINSFGVDNGTEAQRIVVDSGMLVVDAGDDTNGTATAGISQFNGGAASQYIEVGGPVSVLGGDGTNEFAVIHSRGVTGRQDIILDALGDLVVIGGDGTNSYAEIENDGLFQVIDILSGDLLVQGNQDATNGGATATVHAMNPTAVQSINVQDGDMTVLGGAGANEWVTVGQFGAGGQQVINVGNGNLSILGGTGENASADVVSFGIDGATVTQLVTVDGHLFVIADQTNPATTNGWASLRAPNAGAGSQSVDVEGLIEVTGGVGTNEYASIHAAGTGNGGLAQDINALNTVTITGGSGQGASALILTTNAAGDQQLVVQNAIPDAIGLGIYGTTVAGNTGNQAGIVSASTTGTAQTIIVMDGSFVMDANSSVSTVIYGNWGLTAGVVVQSAGGQVIEVQANTMPSDFNMLGGDVAGSAATVAQLGTDDAQYIDVADGNMLLAGGIGQAAASTIASDGLFQEVYVTNGDLTILADQDALNGSAWAYIAAGNADSVQTIIVDVGNVTLQGGSGVNEYAGIYHNFGTNGQQYIEVTDGDLSLQAGDGEFAPAEIWSNGVDNGADLAQQIIVNGDLILIADQLNDATADGYARIRNSGGGAASQFIDVEGVIVLTGGVGTDEYAGIYANGDGSGGIAQDINALHTMTITAGSGQGAYALITSDNATGDQQVVVQNDDGGAVGLGIYGDTMGVNAFNEAGIVSYSETATAQSVQVLDGSVELFANSSVSAQIYGSAGNMEAGAVIHSSGGQGVTIDSGDLTVMGGDVENARAMINQNGTIGGQMIVVDNGDMTLQAGTGESAAVHVTSDGLFQTIEVDGALSLLADQDATNNGGLVEITAVNADVVQTILVNDGDMTLQGGAGDSEYAQVVMLGANGQQYIEVDAGNLLVHAGTGADAFAEINASGLDNGMLAQTIIVNGNLSVVADQMDAATTGGYAAIFQGNPGAASQYIEVTGSVDVLGGVGQFEAANIISQGGVAQSLLLTGSGDLSIIGGDGDSSEATVQGNGLTQDVIVNDGDILVQANQDATNGFGGAYITSGHADGIQTVVATNGGITVQGGPGVDDFAGIASFGGNGQQWVEAGNGDIMVLAGSGSGSFAELFALGADGGNVAQTVLASGDIIVTADGAYAQIYSLESQVMFAGGDMVVTGGNVQNASAVVEAILNQNITILGGLQVLGGTSVDDFDIAIVQAGDGQLINVGAGGIVIAGNAGNANIFGEDIGAGIVNTGGTQEITTTGGGLSMTGGAADGAGVVIVQMDTEDQVIDIVGNSTMTGGSGMGTFAVISGGGDQWIRVTGNLVATGGTANSDDFAAMLAQSEQDLIVTGDFTLDANAASSTIPLGSEVFGAMAFASGDQTVTVGGDFNILGGDNASAVVETEGALQTIIVGGDLNVDDGTGGNAGAISAGDQVITSTGATNLTGDSGNAVGFLAGGDITLTNGGGTWAGVFDIDSPTMVTLNSSGNVDIDETAGEGVVLTPLLVINGAGTIGSGGAAGSASTRLNTEVDEIQFANAGGSVFISEFDAVLIGGTIGNVNLITDNAGDITEGGSLLTATTATLQTADGNIWLDTFTHAVGTFQGVIANNGDFSYVGGATIFANRVSGGEIAAGAGVYADNGIRIETGAANATFTADVVEVGGTGDLEIVAGGIIMDAAGATTGGDATSATDGMFITNDGTQTYDGPVMLLTNTQMSASGAADDIFLGAIDGPGGLTIGSTPTFGGFIGDTTPLAYLILNSTDAYFIVPDADSQAGAFTAVIDGSFINNGTMHLDGPAGTYTFITDNGTIGPGPALFTGGTMMLNGNTINIFGATELQVTGSDLPALQLFNAWNGSPFVVLVGFESGAVYFKGPPPQEDIKAQHERRRDRSGTAQVAYDNMSSTGEYGGRAMGTRLVRPVNVSSFTTMLPYEVSHFTFGRENQAPAAGLESKQLVERDTQD